MWQFQCNINQSESRIQKYLKHDLSIYQSLNITKSFSLLNMHCCWSSFFGCSIFLLLCTEFEQLFFCSINGTLSSLPLFTKTALILSNKTAIVSYKLNRQRSIKHKSKLSVQKRWNTTHTDIWILSGFNRKVNGHFQTLGLALNWWSGHFVVAYHYFFFFFNSFAFFCLLFSGAKWKHYI